MTGGSPVKRMTPPTVNTQARGPFASMQARSEPGTESFRLLTLMTAPPSPPCAIPAKPPAPGKRTEEPPDQVPSPLRTPSSLLFLKTKNQTHTTCSKHKRHKEHK